MAKTATDPGYAACPIRNIVDRFGDKWSLLVLYNLHTGGRLRFSEIHRRMTDISQKMLASTLRRLEQDGLLSRTVYPEVPPRVEYALTPRGESLMPHLVSLIGWALENFDADRQRPQLPASNRTGSINHAPETAKQQASDHRGPRNSARPIVRPLRCHGNRFLQSSRTDFRSSPDKHIRQMHPANTPANAPANAPANTSSKCTRRRHVRSK